MVVGCAREQVSIFVWVAVHGIGLQFMQIGNCKVLNAALAIFCNKIVGAICVQLVNSKYATAQVPKCI